MPHSNATVIAASVILTRATEMEELVTPKSAAQEEAAQLKDEALDQPEESESVTSSSVKVPGPESVTLSAEGPYTATSSAAIRGPEPGPEEQQSQSKSQHQLQSETNPQLEAQRKTISTLTSQISSLNAEILEARSKLRNPDAASTISRHIALLHQYNEMRDVGLGLFGLIAERRGVRLAEILEEYGVGVSD